MNWNEFLLILQFWGVPLDTNNKTLQLKPSSTLRALHVYSTMDAYLHLHFLLDTIFLPTHNYHNVQQVGIAH